MKRLMLLIINSPWSFIIKAAKKTLLFCLINFSKYGMRLSCRRKINKIHSNLSLNLKKIDRSLKARHIAKWSQLTKHINTKYLQVYAHCSGIKSENYVPEDIYYNIVEPCLNYYPMVKAEGDKNYYQKGNFAQYFPRTILRNIEGVYYDSDFNVLSINGDEQLYDFLRHEKELLVKPAMDSGGGRSVFAFKNNGQTFISQNGQKLSIKEIEFALKRNFIVQEMIYQHELLSGFNDTSVNVVRVDTYRSVSSNNSAILSSRLKFGSPGSIISNIKSEGGSIGINPNGNLARYGVVDNTGKIFNLQDNIAIPCYPEIIQVAKELAQDYLYSRVIGVDFTINQDEEIKILDINTQSLGINGHQMLNGPYFGSFTDEVIDYCKEKYSESVKKQAAAINFLKF